MQQLSLHSSLPQQALEGHESEDRSEYRFAILDREKAEHHAIKKIIDDCLGVDDVPIALQAWTNAVAEILLSSKYDTIKIVESTITPIYNKYLVST